MKYLAMCWNQFSPETITLIESDNKEELKKLDERIYEIDSTLCFSEIAEVTNNILSITNNDEEGDIGVLKYPIKTLLDNTINEIRAALKDASKENYFYCEGGVSDTLIPYTMEADLEYDDFELNEDSSDEEIISFIKKLYEDSYVDGDSASQYILYNYNSKKPIWGGSDIIGPISPKELLSRYEIEENLKEDYNDKDIKHRLNISFTIDIDEHKDYSDVDDSDVYSIVADAMSEFDKKFLTKIDYEYYYDWVETSYDEVVYTLDFEDELTEEDKNKIIAVLPDTWNYGDIVIQYGARHDYNYYEEPTYDEYEANVDVDFADYEWEF